MRTRLIPFSFLFLVLAGCGIESQRDSEQTRWEQRASSVEIIRDDFGVPHIFGKTDADAVFGLLYAQCEDDFNRVEYNYIWSTGRLAELEGPKAIYNDVRANMYMTKEEAVALYESSPLWLKDLCVAFADGINYYLSKHPEVKPKVIHHFEPWMPLYFSEGSIGGDIERISLAKIEAFYNQDSATASTYESVRMDDFWREPTGSNGIALSGKLTTSGDAMLLINPHTSFFFRGEVHVVSDEGLNAYGAVTWGQFFVYQGFNEKAGWMHTSTNTDRVDEFEEVVTKDANGWQYRYGETSRPLRTQTVTIRYKDGATTGTKEVPIYRTHHGPITHRNSDRWVSTAMPWEPVQALEQSFKRTKVRNFQEFQRVMELRTNATNNTVYADADGTIAYYHGNFLPAKNYGIDYTQPVDGSDPETDWTGKEPVANCITLVNPSIGWIQNCNSTPFTAAGPDSPIPDRYPPSTRLDEENYRGVHAIRLLNDAREMTLDKFIDLGYESTLPAFEVLIPGLIKAYDQSTPRNSALRDPIQTLRQWDFKVSTASVATSLAHFYGMRCLLEAETGSGLPFMDRIASYSNTLSAARRLEIFEGVVAQLERDFGTWNTPWGEINRYQRINGEIVQRFNDSLPSVPIGMASGRWGALASFGAAARDNTKRIYGTSGNSFVAVVEFGDRVNAKSMLAGGQSGDPGSPHFDDQVERYATAEFKDVAFYREDIERRAGRRYHPGE
jgi:acyl-homoserine lactone acylase PvdQ